MATDIFMYGASIDSSDESDSTQSESTIVSVRDKMQTNSLCLAYYILCCLEDIILQECMHNSMRTRSKNHEQYC